MRILIRLAALAALLPAAASAQSAPAAMDHAAMHAMGHGPAAPQEPGQSAFAAIAEIVAMLRADPATDWERVDIEALRQHLIDMDEVTLHADIAARPAPGGARFDVTSAAPRARAAIRAMTLAHAAAMDGAGGWRMTAQEIDGGAALTVTGPAADAAMIRGLGYIGVMASGMHHQAHHLAIASGARPHGARPHGG